jgi:hypothetical protein
MQNGGYHMVADRKTGNPIVRTSNFIERAPTTGWPKAFVGLP